MALIIEDGSIVANANSYVTVQEIRDYAALRGFTLPVDDASVEVLAILSMDYLESLNYKGSLVEPNVQPLQWPRKDVYINCDPFPSDEIPSQIKNAQIEGALAAQAQSLLNDGSARPVTKEKAEQLETEYATTQGQLSFISSRVNRYLSQLLQPISVIRV